jgi:hypothetical protein
LCYLSDKANKLVKKRPQRVRDGKIDKSPILKKFLLKVSLIIINGKLKLYQLEQKKLFFRYPMKLFINIFIIYRSQVKSR